ncbi:hypothetical protein FTO74_02805 [Granulicella sp. WH15]|uniref:DUF7079 family protein n=1 Tax=Granulicella sp. WH15 TaxID=2602070 RepID=UPI0013670745|nr:hypothetical protein [Granulicella sp. WH15]QHN02419.1 hypothetical protein FTO74_02805 [Granulicella sp. WH15]
MNDFDPADESFLSESEIVARVPVWTALAQLFSDNKMQGADYDAVSAVLRGAGLDAAAARHILVHEVAPVFYEQLDEAAEKNWTGWSAAEVERMMREFLARSASRRKWLGVQAGRMSRRVMLGGWDAVERRMLEQTGG